MTTETLCKDRHQRPAVPYQERCRDCSHAHRLAKATTNYTSLPRTTGALVTEVLDVVAQLDYPWSTCRPVRRSPVAKMLGARGERRPIVAGSPGR